MAVVQNICYVKPVIPKITNTYKNAVYKQSYLVGFVVVQWRKDANSMYRPTAKATHMDCIICSAVPSDLISQPRVMFGRMLGSAFIRSRVCIMASTLWIPYCSRTAPHFRSWTLMKQPRDKGLDNGHHTQKNNQEKHCTTPCLQAVGGGPRTELQWWCRLGCALTLFSQCSGRWPQPDPSGQASWSQPPGGRSASAGSRKAPV